MTAADAMVRTVPVDRKAISDLRRLKEDFDAVVESIELQSDKAFMKSHQKAKKQIRDRDFGEWDDV